MLKTAKMTMKNEKSVMLIGSSKPKKNLSKQGKEKSSQKGKMKPKGGVKKVKPSPVEKGNCFHCGKLGH